MEKELKDYSHKKIVYIDDNAINLKVGCMSLKKFGLTPDEGSHMVDLFKYLDEEKREYYLLLLDDMMDVGITGTEAMQQLKAREYSKPIVVLTANDTSADKERYLAAGFDDYLAKPVNLTELARVLDKFLG